MSVAKASASYSSSTSRRPSGFTLQAVARTAYSYETQRLLKTLLTRQAVKTVLNYLSETNGELHFFLHNYLSEHPLPLAGETDADAWLVELASSPYTTVSDPRRSSVPTVAAKAVVMQGERAVSPRDVADRIMGLREHIAQEMQEELGAIHGANSDVNRRALEKTMTDFTVEPGANAQQGE
ncbi:hypothetical protein OEZ85_006377 [Tetradesmus obliquus]|uniref:Uncharacterized protein n=1 Tax=Tetradesmus obliquus TaxID=3088 RepID=A0ABY8TV32_TETOB|nr:hypothetical protein OEZ85_006377 [Tetradesmus obliquus]